MQPDNPAEHFTDTEVPAELRPLFPAALRRAYSAADITMERDDYLATPGAKYQRGDLIMLAASYEFEQLLKRGLLPGFDGTWEFFAKPTGKHFVMLTSRARITLNQVQDPRKKPRRAVFRNNYAELNEAGLFDSFDDELKRAREEAERDGARRLLHILHGYHDLDFAHIAYPHPERNRHIYRSRNLMQLPHEVSSDLPAPEGPSESPNPEAFENFERHLKDDE
ncbi:MAG: hypothetical protein KIT48_21965 [Pseudolabrys sp.]|nr:hypothetical protein [Pseudolabrys sp.]